MNLESPFFKVAPSPPPVREATTKDHGEEAEPPTSGGVAGTAKQSNDLKTIYIENVFQMQIVKRTIVNQLACMGIIHINSLDKVAGRLQHHLAKLVTNDQWVRDTVRGYKLDLVSEPSHSSHIESRSAPVHPTGSNRFDKHGGDLGGIRPPDRFLFNPVFGSQERRGSETSNKFESTKRICSNATFQDGRNPYLEGRPGDWLTKLDPKDTYFTIPIHPGHKKFLRFLLQVQLSPLWPLISPVGLYQDPKASI